MATVKTVSMEPAGLVLSSIKATPGSVATAWPPLVRRPAVSWKGVASLQDSGLTGPAPPTKPPVAA